MPRALAFLRALLALAFSFTLARADLAPAPAAAPFSAKELAQGYRDHVILAKPRAAHRATIDVAESSENLRVSARYPLFGDLRVIELDSPDSADAAIARLTATGRYEYVARDDLRHADVTPNEPAANFTQLWSLNNTGQSNGIVGADIRALTAWDTIHDAPDVVVAVIDSGARLTHTDLAANLWRNPSPLGAYDLNGARFTGNNGRQTLTVPDDDNSHGTHVAGTIGAVGNNATGTVGVAWKTQLMVLKFLQSTGTGAASDGIACINWAVNHGATIINASFGESAGAPPNAAELTALRAARDAGVIFVAAAGNDGSSLDLGTHYPASYPLDNIIAVGNSGRRDEAATSSNYGAGVELFAPGSEILSLGNTTNTALAIKSGTSMAAPHVAGALALLKQQWPTDTYRQLINRLLRAVDTPDSLAGKAHTSGRLNLAKLVTSTDNRPFHDHFSERARLLTDNITARASTTGSTRESGEPEHGVTGSTATVWWQWTATAGGAVTISTSDATFDTALALYTGTNLDTLTLLAANDDAPGAGTLSRITFTATPGATYQIALTGKNAASGFAVLNLGTIPANDAFATPASLTGASVLVNATNKGASREAGEPRILANTGGTSLWYRWTAPKSGRFQLAATSPDFDPMVALYTGTSLSALALVAASDDLRADSADTAAVATFTATAGTTYALTLDSKSGSGSFTLTLNDSLWQYAATDSITTSPAVAPDGTVYFGSIDKKLYALAPDGTEKWTVATQGSLDSASPAVAADGTIYAGSNDGLLYAVRPADGSTKWTFDLRSTSSSHYGSPTIGADGTIYQGGDDDSKTLFAVNPADGTQKWSAPTDGGIYTPPAIDSSGNVYVITLTGGAYSFTSAGVQRWFIKAGGNCTSTPALSADGATLYFGAYDKKLYALDTATGATRWTYPLGDEVRASSPAVDAAGVIYLGCYDQKLYAVNSNGTLNRTYATGRFIRSAPAIFGTTLYFGSNDHKLYAFDLGTGPAPGPWAQYRANSRRLGRAVAETFGIGAQPQSQTLLAGAALTLSVIASGPGPLAYQWKKDGVTLAGATSTTFTLPAATLADSGSYTCVVTGPSGTLTSAAATVSVETPNPGRLINLSVRTTAGAGAQTLIVGFTLAGSPDKPILLRAIGPTLSAFGLTGLLADPALSLLSASTTLATNDNWAIPSATTLAAAFATSGAFALDPASLDAALLRTLSPGGYTAQVTGTGGGLALAELYDTAPATGARFTNVSARSAVGAGGTILIAGFTISGNVPKQILLRATGPGLAQFGVTGRLPDPRLELYTAAGTKIAENDNWATPVGAAANSTALALAAVRVGAFAYASTTALDSALLVTLPPGGYTAQVSGATPATGVALVELYEVP